MILAIGQYHSGVRARTEFRMQKPANTTSRTDNAPNTVNDGIHGADRDAGKGAVNATATGAHKPGASTLPSAKSLLVGSAMTGLDDSDDDCCFIRSNN